MVNKKRCERARTGDKGIMHNHTGVVNRGWVGGTTGSVNIDGGAEQGTKANSAQTLPAKKGGNDRADEEMSGAKAAIITSVPVSYSCRQRHLASRP